jgi:hypothetical protein
LYWRELFEKPFWKFLLPPLFSSFLFPLFFFAFFAFFAAGCREEQRRPVGFADAIAGSWYLSCLRCDKTKAREIGEEK